MINIHEIQLTGEDEFTERFNYVSRLYKKMWDKTDTPEEHERWVNAYFEAKLALEQGYPILFIKGV